MKVKLLEWVYMSAIVAACCKKAESAVQPVSLRHDEGLSGVEQVRLHGLCVTHKLLEVLICVTCTGAISLKPSEDCGHQCVTC